MKNIFFRHSQRGRRVVMAGFVLGFAWLLGSASLQAVTVATLGGGDPHANPKYLGYRDGTTLSSALFHTPCGLAIDNTGSYLFVADRDNNAIRYLDLAAGQTWTFGIVNTNLVNKPVGVVVDAALNVYVLNRGNGNNGSVITFDSFGDTVATNATGLTNACGITMDNAGSVYVTLNSNKVIRISSFYLVTNFTTVTNITVSSTNIVTTTNVLPIATSLATNRATIATIPIAGTSLQGIVAKHNGFLAACDAGRNGIYLINPLTGVVTTNAGFHGQGDFIANGNNVASSSTAKFFQPTGIAETGDGTLIVTDFGNNRVKVVLASGVVTNLYGVMSNYWGGTYKGWYDGAVTVPDSIAPNAQSRLPFGVVFGPDGAVYTSEDYYHLIRKTTGTGFVQPPPVAPAAPAITSVLTNYGTVTLNWTASATATSYNVKRSPSINGPFTTIANVTGTTYTDTTVINGTTYYYVVSALNSGGEGPNSAVVNARPPLPAVPDPQIGYVDFPATSLPFGYTSVFHPVSSFVFNNDTPIVIVGAAGSQTYYTYGLTSTNPIPDPTSVSASVAPGYQDGLSPNQALLYSVVPVLPDLTIKAIGEKPDGSPNSAVVQARFQFITANPTITGDNAAQFTISDFTANAHLYYTTDGSDPSSTNGFDLGTVATPTNLWTVGFSITSNTVFKVRAFRNNYQASAVVSTSFSASNFVANVISFGFASGEASSDFVASPGQLFYAPVTLSPLSGTTIYGLQFNLTVTNAGPNPGPAVGLGAYGFTSMLMKPIPDVTPTVYESITPAMFATTNGFNPSPVTVDGSTNFTSLVFTNYALNLMGVGWLERASKTNLYDTVKQDLIQFSMAHDTLFPQAGGKVIVGGYSFQVPGNAINGQTYKIQIARPTATSDGIGAAASDVFIAAPTNGATAGGPPVSALKYVTVGQRKYIAGSAYPFRWFNAGDFGSSNIVNADVMQVFQSAVYALNYPPLGSDFFDTMDSCGNIGVLDSDNADPNFGNYTNSLASLNTAQLSALFSGNDTTINQIAFGDGQLDICDVYVTFRRSLDPTLTWYRRFWNNGLRVADTGAPNIANHVVLKTKAVSSKVQTVPSTVQPKVNFAAGDIQGAAGQVVQIPITATIYGSYSLRVLLLNLTVEPLDGSPTITTPVQFNQNATLIGAPYTTDSRGSGNYSAVWLNTTNSGLTGTVTLGTLTVTIPAGASANAAYGVHFDHASASPNGMASFPKQTMTGLITLASRTNSTYGDGIPDSWRLRWFGTVNNYLSVSNACASGDGVNNYMKYVAGVDPSIANNFPSVNAKTPVPIGATTAIHWPTVSGKQYAIERSTSLFPGNWSAIATNTGTGTDMEFDDNASGAMKFYRVRILP